MHDNDLPKRFICGISHKPLKIQHKRLSRAGRHCIQFFFIFLSPNQNLIYYNKIYTIHFVGLSSKVIEYEDRTPKICKDKMLIALGITP